MKFLQRISMVTFNYYYLVPSLPTLSLNNSRGMSCVTFLQRCAQSLRQMDLEILGQSIIDNFAPQTPFTVFRKWQEWETDLRNQLIVLRCQKLGVDPNRFTRSGNDSIRISNSVREAFTASNPLETENSLHKIRWRFLDDVEKSDRFNLNFLIIYHVKLQLLERRKKHSLVRGIKILEEMGAL